MTTSWPLFLMLGAEVLRVGKLLTPTGFEFSNGTQCLLQQVMQRGRMLSEAGFGSTSE